MPAVGDTEASANRRNPLETEQLRPDVEAGIGNDEIRAPLLDPIRFDGARGRKWKWSTVFFCRQLDKRAAFLVGGRRFVFPAFAFF